MPFRFSHLNNLGDQVPVPIPTDEEGYRGRECPQSECEGYFKIKPGTGLQGENLPCICPYCGHQGPADHFWTKGQIEYAKSVVLRNVTDAVRKASLGYGVRDRWQFIPTDNQLDERSMAFSAGR